MKILLIGTGYVGSALPKAWKKRDDRFIALTTTPEKIAQLEKLPLVERAILPPFEAALAECEGVVIAVAPKADTSYEKTYLETAKRLEKELRKHSKPLYLVYISSTSVYGQHECATIDETTPPQPKAPEGKLLLETENILLNCPAEVCVLRLGGIYGPGREIAKRAERLSGREMPGAGDRPTNHSHLDDITRAIAFAFENRLTGIYNVVSDAHPTREELYKKFPYSPPRWNPELPQLHGCNSAVSNKKMKQAGFTFLPQELK